MTAPSSAAGRPDGTDRHDGPDRPGISGRPDGIDATDGFPPPRPAYDIHTWKEIAHLLLNLPTTVFGFVYAITVLAASPGAWGRGDAQTLPDPTRAGCLEGALQMVWLQSRTARSGHRYFGDSQAVCQ